MHGGCGISFACLFFAARACLSFLQEGVSKSQLKGLGIKLC